MEYLSKNETEQDNELIEFDRLNMIRDTINKYGEDKFYVSFSGGRDSTVLSAFIDVALPGNHIPRVFANTGIEFNAIVDFVKECQEKDDRIIIIKPSINIKDGLERDGYPFKSKEHSENVRVYQNIGEKSITYQKYCGLSTKKTFLCPKKLRYQFSPDFKLKINDKCCENMKENPLRKYGRESGHTVAITGILQNEGGRRSSNKHVGCAVFRKGNLVFFHPFKPVNDCFIDYLIKKYDIKLCRLYYPPYNFTRTGCKGCPFNIKLQKELDVLEKYFPAERKQCEIIWKPVYEEYRRIGYRLRPYEQIDLFDKDKKEEDS